MQHTLHHPRSGATAIAGLLLVAFGVAVLWLQQVGVDVAAQVRAAGWPFFIILPGLALVTFAAVPLPPRGIGFAIAGSVVTTVGLLLLYQSRTGDWESWAYLWALIPLAVALALLGYGALAGEAGMVRAGTWVGGIAGIVLVMSAWLFSAVAEGRSALISGAWGAVLLIALGAMVILRAIVRPAEARPRRSSPPPGTQPASEPEPMTSQGPLRPPI